MRNLIVIEPCTDGSFFCLQPRSAVALISLLSMIANYIDITANKECQCNKNSVKYYINSMRLVLAMLFQLVNLMLLGAASLEKSFLLSIYLSYTLGFTILGLFVSLIDLLIRFEYEGVTGMASFGTEVLYLFVISRCLPLIDSYRKALHEGSL